MKVFIGYHCDGCKADFDVDSRSLSHSDPECPVCGSNNKVKRVYKDDAEEEDEVCQVELPYLLTTLFHRQVDL